MIDHLRKTSEAIILLLVVVSPWAFGCVHPTFQYALTAGICAVLALWSIELLIQPNRSIVGRFQLPLIGLLAIVLFQVLPLGSVADFISPKSASWKQAMLPTAMEEFANGETASIPALSARGRISVYPARTKTRLLWFGVLALLFTRVQDFANAGTLRRLCVTCLINGSILAYFSVIQHFATPEHGRIYWTYQSLGSSFGPFVNRNSFAFYINICFGLSIGLVGSRQIGKFNTFSLESVIEMLKDSLTLWMVSVFVFMVGAVILCSSRGGMISLAGSLFITAAFVGATGTFKQGWKWFVLAAAIFALAAGVQVWLGFDFVDSHYADHTDNRTALWRPLLVLVQQFPVAGIGLGALPYLEPSTRQLAGRDWFLESAHNEYLQLAIETGLPGLLCGLVLLWLLSSKIARRVRESRHNAWLYVGLLFALTSIALHSFTEFGLSLIPAIAFLAVVVSGHIAGVGRTKKAREMSGPWAKTWLRVSALAMLVFCTFAFWEAKQSDLAFRSQLAAQRAGQQGRTDDELAYLRQAAMRRPNDVELLLDVARLRFESKNAETLANESALLEAQRVVIAARELCPLTAESHFFLGRYRETFKAGDDDLTYYSRALAARPTDAELRYITGLTYLQRNDAGNATEMFRQSLDLSTVHLPDILERSLELEFASIRRQLLPAENANVISVAADWFQEQQGTASTESKEQDYAQLVVDLRRQALATKELQNANSALSYELKATLHTKLGEIDQAIAAYKSALRFASSNTAMRMELTRLLGVNKQYPEARRQIIRVLQQSPNSRNAQRLRDALIHAEMADEGERRREN